MVFGTVQLVGIKGIVAGILQIVQGKLNVTHTSILGISTSKGTSFVSWHSELCSVSKRGLDQLSSRL